MASTFRREWLKDRREPLGWQLETERRSAGSGRKGRDVCEPQPRCGQVASRRTRESTRDQRPFRSPGDWGSTRGGPPNRLLETLSAIAVNRRGPPALAARRAGYPWPEQMDRKMSRKRGVHAARNGRGHNSWRPGNVVGPQRPIIMWHSPPAIRHSRLRVLRPGIGSALHASHATKCYVFPALLKFGKPGVRRKFLMNKWLWLLGSRRSFRR